LSKSGEKGVKMSSSIIYDAEKIRILVERKVVNVNHAEHFLEKSRLTYGISEFVNLHLLADPTYPRNPKTFGQELRKKRMDLGLQIKELARLVRVTSDTIINWELRNVKPVEKNLAMVKEYLKLDQAKREF